MKSSVLEKTFCSVKGQIVSLEPFSIAYAKEFWKLYRNSKEKWNKFIRMNLFSLNDVSDFLLQQYRDDFTGYVVIENKSQKITGFIIGDEISERIICRTRAMGKKYEGLGYGYEATQLFEKLMKDAGYQAIVIYCDVNNIHSRQLAERDGFYRLSVYESGNTTLLEYIKQLN